MNAPRKPRKLLGTVQDVVDTFMQRTNIKRDGEQWANVVQVLGEFTKDRGTLTVDELIPDDLEGWIEAHEQWKSSWTKKRAAQTVSGAFSFCYRKGLIDRHPFVGVSYPQGERMKPMSEEHFQALLRGTTPAFRRVLIFLWYTGCRPSEAANLKWKYIDVENAVATLHEHKTAHARKDRAPRIIVLPDKIIRLLIWLLEDQRDEQEYVFVNSKGGPWNRRSLGLRIFRARKRLGISAGVAQLYGTRHSFGTRLAIAGVELKTLSTLMGHTTSKMSEHYIHLAGQTQHLHSALEKGIAKPDDKKGKESS